MKGRATDSQQALRFDIKSNQRLGAYKVRINQRLNLGFLAIALWAAVVGHIALFKIKQISTPLKGDIERNLESIDRTEDLAFLAQVMLYHDEVSMQSARNYAFTQDTRWEQRYRDGKSRTAGIMKEMIKKAGEEELDALASADKGRLALAELENTSIELVNNGKAKEAIELLESSRYRDQRTVHEEFLEDYAGRARTGRDGALLRSVVRRVQDSTESSKRLVSLFALIVLIIALSLGLLISRSISNPLARLRVAAAAIGKGDLDTKIEVKSDDEIGLLAASFKGMANDLKKTTTSIDNLNREIVERKKAEEAASLAYEELENASRELKEMQSQQVQSAKLASIGQLAAGIAHELNTPLGFVAYNFETLENYVTKMREILEMYGKLFGEIETSERSELLSQAAVVANARNSMQINYVLENITGLLDDSREGLKGATSIVRSLRDFSRIDELEDVDKYDINDGIRTSVAVANYEIERVADIEMELADVPEIICNAGQINQVLLNLLINAAQAIKSQEETDRGSIKIRTYATEGHVVCEISNNGPGIEPDHLPQIFDPFFTTRAVGQGTGLGLSISHDIVVAKHKGKLLVESPAGEGAKFTMKLPVQKEHVTRKCEVENHGKKNGVVC